MANKRYSEFAKNLGFPSTNRMEKQGDEGTPAKTSGAIYGKRGKKDPGGEMPMRYGTADWKMPGEFKTQPRDRTWGMRSADCEFNEGLYDSETGLEPQERGSHIRGSDKKSR